MSSDTGCGQLYKMYFSVKLNVSVGKWLSLLVMYNVTKILKNSNNMKDRAHTVKPRNP